MATPLPPPAARPRVLFVDDDRLVRTAYLRQLRARLDVVTAQNGEEALALVEAGPPFVAVFTDFQMPGLNGVQLLSRLRTLAPDTVRVLFTGKADLHTMADAVNEGEIFRVLLKPCATAQLWACVDAVLARHAAGPGVTVVEVAAPPVPVPPQAPAPPTPPPPAPVDAGAAAHALSVLIERTNRPLARRQHRLQAYVRHMAAALRLAEADQIHHAAMLSGLALIAADEARIDRLGTNRPDDAEERTQFTAAWSASAELVRLVPGLEDIADIIAAAAQPAPGSLALDALPPGVRGAAVLRTAWQLDVALMRGDVLDDALHALRSQGRAPVRLLEALRDVRVQGLAWVVESRDVVDLEVGMTLEQPVKAQGGLTLAPAGQVITPSLLRSLHGYIRTAGIVEPLSVRVPTPPD